MPTAREFELVQVQTSAYTPDLRFQSGKLLAYLLASRWGELFDGEPIVPPSVPSVGLPSQTLVSIPQLPKLIMQSESGQLKLQAAPPRVDFFWMRTSPDDLLDLTEHLNLATELLGDYLDYLGVRPGRLACVLTRLVLDPSPGMTLATHFCQPRWIAGPLKRPQAFELHAHKRFLLGGEFEVNSWVRCKSGALQQAVDPTDPNPRPRVIVVEQDMNTLAEELGNREYAPEEVISFFSYIPPAAEEVLELYFPEGSTDEQPA